MKSDFSYESVAVHQVVQDLRRGQVAHSYLFTGRATEEKMRLVLSFAEGLLCLRPEEGKACGSCGSCLAWKRSAHPDFYSLEPEGGSFKIEQLRAVSRFFNYRPQLGSYQVFLLQAPELLTLPAANSLLKALEEPLPQTVFLLVTEDERLLLPTIVSRCRVVAFCQPKALEEAGMLAEEGALNKIKDELLLHIRDAKESGLLRVIRLSKFDRDSARQLMRLLLLHFERLYYEQRNRAKHDPMILMVVEEILECLRIILRCIQLLDENVSVPLLLALNLREIQKRVQKFPLDVKNRLNAP